MQLLNLHVFINVGGVGGVCPVCLNRMNNSKLSTCKLNKQRELSYSTSNPSQVEFFFKIKHF